MQHQEFEPPEQLRNSIKCFWHNKRQAEPRQSSFEVPPDGYAEIIFHFSNDLSIVINGKLQPLPSPFMMGLLNQPVVFNSISGLDIIGIRCFPWTVFDLLNLPPGNDGVRIFKHPIAKLHPMLTSLVSSDNINDAIALIKQYFIDQLALVNSDTMLIKAGEAMRNAKGTLQVSQVAEAAHATVRTLERRFKQSSGYSVKDVSGLMRFEQARNHLWLNPDCNLAGLAHELGYADQSHLSKEFKRYSGTTPAAFARKSKKGKQALGNDFITFTQA
ncbi:helix-turn-helix domain-containing protein [Mucilaginibacter flavus]|uniref:helix-turn-helix domain-containing protein n=1 Tax=Mucilaginibacter flavus TaxID=931504 RepID=UPI0025B41AB9|nr:helix-turn-helix domain-containing protein [Mucilaginibacter flavus]MDN3584676.1 helix-turn-helix domain-containing protein [Mucilaginibacter flavus]